MVLAIFNWRFVFCANHFLNAINKIAMVRAFILGVAYALGLYK